jgi:hypothetical protein
MQIAKSGYSKPILVGCLVELVLIAKILRKAYVVDIFFPKYFRPVGTDAVCSIEG